MIAAALAMAAAAGAAEIQVEIPGPQGPLAGTLRMPAGPAKAMVSVLKIIPQANHVLKIAPQDMARNFATYGSPDLPLAPGFVEAIADFVRR